MVRHPFLKNLGFCFCCDLQFVTNKKHNKVKKSRIINIIFSLLYINFY